MESRFPGWYDSRYRHLKHTEGTIFLFILILFCFYPHTLNILCPGQTLVVKVCGVICSVVGGLAVGKVNSKPAWIQIIVFPNLTYRHLPDCLCFSKWSCGGGRWGYYSNNVIHRCCHLTGTCHACRKGP